MMDELLEELSPHVRAVLDTEQFARLDADQSAALHRLSELTGAHVVAHRLAMRRGLPLWEVAGPAYDLRKDELDALHQTEGVMGSNIALVAYARPLELRLPAHVLVEAAHAYRDLDSGSSEACNSDRDPHRD